MTDVLHLSARDNKGGAARATYRLHCGLRDLGVTSPGGRLGVIYDTVRRKLDALPVWRYRDRNPGFFSPAWLPEHRDAGVRRHQPDIVNLHWIAGGFLHPKTVAQFESPVVWTLHDMWPFTGGCHYVGSCEKYEDSCGACPHLGSNDPDDLSRSTWERKHEAWQDIDFTVVAPSKWLATCAKASSLFGNATVKVIPNGLDIESFRPRPPDSVRSRLGISLDANLICFGADWGSLRKGTDLLLDALTRLETQADGVQVAVFGHVDTDHTPDLDIPVKYLGFVDEDVLKGLYSDADVVVVPSRQEAFGQTASEALASGTPVVAFNATGPRDIVDHEETGYLAIPFEVDDLARGIDWILADADRQERLSERARKVAIERFSVPTVATQYRTLYDRLF
jgi:glycosyltransferase involved in cell wall biosynthesis